MLNFSSKNQWTESEIETFLTQLGQVINWTNYLSKDFADGEGFYGNVFRKTNPMIDETPLYTIDGGYATWNLDEQNPDLYDIILEYAIANRPKENVDLSQISQLGRVLSFETSITTNDGAAIVESQCFVDESDVPPIDTWFFLKSDYYHSGHRCKKVLFCWIPEKFVPVMNAAITVEMMDSYRWVDENDLFIMNSVKSGN